MEGSRQIANMNYGICIAAAAASCSITYSPLSSDPYSFTMSGDVGGVDPTMLGSATLQLQTCTTDYVIIPVPSQTGTPLSSGIDRFCGLGLSPTTSNSIHLINILTSNKLKINLDFMQVTLNHLFCMQSRIRMKRLISEIGDLHWLMHKMYVR